MEDSQFGDTSGTCEDNVVSIVKLWSVTGHERKNRKKFPYQNLGVARCSTPSPFLQSWGETSWICVNKKIVKESISLIEEVRAPEVCRRLARQSRRGGEGISRSSKTSFGGLQGNFYSLSLPELAA